MVDKNLPFPEASPLFLTVPDFGTRLSVEWEHLAVQTGRADHQQPFKRLRKCLRQRWLVLWVVLALCTGRNPTSSTCLSPLGFLPEAGVFFGSRTSSRHINPGRCQQVDGKPWWCSPRASSREGTNRSSASGAPQALAAPPRCCEMLLENPSGITPRLLPPSARIHSLIHESVSRFLSQPVTLLKTIHLRFKPWNGLWPSPLLSVVGMTFQQGTCLCRGLAGKIWLCWGFGPRWPEGKEQEFFILRRGFRFYFCGSKVTCMHKVFECFQHAALSL